MESRRRCDVLRDGGGRARRCAARRAEYRGVAAADARRLRLQSRRARGGGDRRGDAGQSAAAAEVSQSQCAQRAAARVSCHRAGDAQSRPLCGGAARSERPPVLLDRRRSERMAAARSLRLPGGARRLRVGDAAASGSDGASRARRRRETVVREGTGAMTRAIAGVALVASAITIHAADPPRRKPLDPKQRAAVLAMVKAVELAQATDVVDEGAVEWDSHVFKSGDHVGYVPFRVGIPAGAGFKPSAMYVRAVSRHDGTRAVDEHSRLREWLLKGGDIMPRMAETAYVGTGEMPVGGIANGSSRQATAAAAAASAVFVMQMQDFEK